MSNTLIQLGSRGYISGGISDRPGYTFFRYRDEITDREVKCVSSFGLPGNNQADVDASMSEWVRVFFRHAEYVPGSAETFNTERHAGTWFPVPTQNILHHCKTPAYQTPPPRRISVLVQKAIQKQVPRKQVRRVVATGF